MKKTLLMLAISAIVASPSLARADWSSDLQAAINSNNFAEINVIAANNPNDQGGIALALLTAAKNDVGSHDGTAIKLFTLATPFADQLSPSQALPASTAIVALVGLAGNPELQHKDPKGAHQVFTAALTMSSDSPIATVRPGLHNFVVAAAEDFGDKYAQNDPDKKDLDDHINLALQVGSPPPLGPHGVLTPSPE
ncbi:MAG: hypothetical protein P4M15_11650 [Alphaproteobacteria bacterium]|nr:hypothetical protein [Alphaproteobacteria bacterium]